MPPGSPHPSTGHRPSLGSCPDPLAPALQAKLGGSEMSLLARVWPSLTLEQNMGQGSRKRGALAIVSLGWSASFLWGSQVQCCQQGQNPG